MTATSPPPRPRAERSDVEVLPRRLGAWSAASVVVGSTVGSGIFRTPAVVAERVSSEAMVYVAWGLGAVVALCGALAFAELSARFPHSGGLYVYLREIYGPRAAFVFGWCELLVLRPAAYGAIALTSAAYALRAFGVVPEVELVTPWGVTRAQGLACLLIVQVAAIHARGVVGGARLLNASTVLKVVALLGLVLASLVLASPSPAESRVVVSALPGPGPGGVGAFGFALVAVFWAYDGWADLGFVGGEVRNPERTLPRAFILGTSCVAIAYLTLQVAYLRVVSLEHMRGSSLVAADLAQALFGSTGAVIVAIVIALSTFGTLTGSMMTGPRVFFAMARDGFLVSGLGVVDRVHETPARAIWFSAILGVVFVSLRGFGELADQFVLGIWPFYALGVWGVVRCRRNGPFHARFAQGAWAWGYPVAPFLFLAATAFVLAQVGWASPWTLGANVAVLGTGVLVFEGIVRARRDRFTREGGGPHNETT